ncbi:histone H3.2 [Mycena olivaceomarginata]|nr:histone H3.2 [Mycena olivaceomarginata]
MARNKQTFCKSTSGKCRPHPMLVDTDSLSPTGKAPVVQLPYMTPLPQPTQPKSRRHRAGTVALREIRKYKKDTSLLIPKTSFQCLVKEITGDYQRDVALTPSASSRMSDSNLPCLQRFRGLPKTQPRDMALVLRVRGDSS